MNQTDSETGREGRVHSPGPSHLFYDHFIILPWLTLSNLTMKAEDSSEMSVLWNHAKNYHNFDIHYCENLESK